MNALIQGRSRGISEQMQRARAVLRHTQAEAAHVAGVSVRTWHRLESEEARSLDLRRNLLVIDAYLHLAGMKLNA